MASLRARLLAALLALTALGLLLLGGITYVEQRSFELDRVDAQARSALPAVARELEAEGVGGGVGGVGGVGEGLGGSGGVGGPGGPPGGGPPRGGGSGGGLPPGTYGERRDASGDVTGEHVFETDQDIAADPALPADMPLGRVFTVDGEGDDDGSYRVYAERNRIGGGITVVAVPLADIDERLNRLLLVELLVIGGVLLVLGLVAWIVVRVGLLPLDRMGHTAGAIAGGDLSHRVESTDPRTEVGRLGIALNAMLDRLEQAFSQRQASEDRLRRFLADASHELRTPLASIRGYAELFRMGAAREPVEVEKAMRRIEDEAARMGVLVEDLLMLARLDEIAEAPHSPVELAALAADAVADARATAPDRAIVLDAGFGAGAGADAGAGAGAGAGACGCGCRRGRADRARRCPPAAPGAREPPPKRPRAHARRHADRGLRGGARRRRPARGPRPRPRAPERRAGRPVRALLACGGRPRARQGRRGPGPRDRCRDRRRSRRRGRRRQRARRRRRVRGAAAGRRPRTGCGRARDATGLTAASPTQSRLAPERSHAL